MIDENSVRECTIDEAGNILTATGTIVTCKNHNYNFQIGNTIISFLNFPIASLNCSRTDYQSISNY